MIREQDKSQRKLIYCICILLYFFVIIRLFFNLKRSDNIESVLCALSHLVMKIIL